MLATKSTSIFFHHGISSFDPKENDFLKKHYPESLKWERGIFTHDGQGAPYYVSRAKNQKALVVGGTGLKTQYLLNPSEVKRLNDSGISVIWMALPEIRGTAPFMDKYKTLLKNFLTDKNSPVFMLFPEDVIRYVGVHSTSGELFADIMHDDKDRRKIVGNYGGVVYYAPYVDTANASREHSSRFNQIAFNFYASMNLDKKPHDTLAAKIYLCLKASAEPFTSLPAKITDEFVSKEDQKLVSRWAEGLKQTVEDSKLGQFWKLMHAATPDISPTYRNILEVQESGRRLVDNFNAQAMNALPSIFLIGDHDPFACHKTTLDLAQKMGASISTIDSGETNPVLLHTAAENMAEKKTRAEVIIAKGGGHDPIRNNPALLEIFIDRVEQCAALHERIKSETTYISPHLYAREPEIEIYTVSDRLRDSARFALQSGTRFLYTAASFL